MKKLFLIVLSLLLVISCCAGAMAENIMLGHALSEGTPASDGINAFAEAVAEKTEGRVSFTIFPNGQLGSETDMLEQMQMNTLGAAGIMCGTMQSLDMRMAIEDLEKRVANASSAGERVKLNKQLKKLQEQAEELRKYEEKIHHLADMMIDIDLDDGVKVNYAKFADVLAPIK